ncbi:MAG: P-loop NTPase [Crenarchaeota archaeon]|nr:P-loop NTPase [Thermoproteota archaeon]
MEISIVSGKGGVGKSLLAAHLAILLSRKWRLIAVDADAEAPNMHIVLGIKEWDRVIGHHEGRRAFILQDKCTGCGECLKACQFGAIRVDDGKYVVDKWLCEGCYTCSLVCPVKAIRFERDVLAGWIRVKETTRWGFPLVSAEITPGRPNSGKLVTEARNTGRAINNNADLMLLDSAAGIGCQVIASLAGSHAAILVAEPTRASISDLKRVIKLVQHFRIPSMLVVNKYDLNTELYEEILGIAEKNKIDVLGRIPYDENVPRSYVAMKPLIEYNPDSPAAQALIEIGDRLDNVLSRFDEWRLEHLPEAYKPFTPIVIRPGETLG